MTDPDEVVRIHKLQLQITILDAEERGFQKAVDALAQISNIPYSSKEWADWLSYNKALILKGGE